MQFMSVSNQGELSKPVSPFYMEISTIGKFEKELGRGMALY